MFCSKCGKENADDAKFCASCGQAMGEKPADSPKPSIVDKSKEQLEKLQPVKEKSQEQLNKMKDSLDTNIEKIPEKYKQPKVLSIVSLVVCFISFIFVITGHWFLGLIFGIGALLAAYIAKKDISLTLAKVGFFGSIGVIAISLLVAIIPSGNKNINTGSDYNTNNTSTYDGGSTQGSTVDMEKRRKCCDEKYNYLRNLCGDTPSYQCLNDAKNSIDPCMRGFSGCE